jgi:RNA polymerase sigma factor (sigma-70 family)
MKILVAGATGALGAQLVPQLVARGHEVVGMTRGASRRDAVRALGATPAVADALDPDAVARVVAEAEPEVIVHQLTALSGAIDLRHFDRTFAQTNRLRTEGTDHLLAAGRAVGVRRFVAQSFAGWPSARDGGPVKSEEDPLDPSPAAAMRETLDAIRHLERAVVEATWSEGVALRYGGFYGPGTSMDARAEHAEQIRKRRFPVVGSGAGVWSFVHIADAAEATVAAVEHGRRGIYNVVDDEPARVADWLPAVARTLGAKPPRHVPRTLARLLTGNPGGDDDRRAGRLECQGKARARLAAAPSELARRHRGGRRGHAARRGARRVTRPDPEPLDELRPVAFGIAYRMLGSVAEAQDVVQESLLRVHQALEDGQRIESPRAFVATIATRLAIDELRSARVRRETYVGEWLPEPLLADPADDPARRAELADSLSLAFLVLLESLSPEQRAALLLRDVFDYGYAEIAQIVGTTEWRQGAGARALAARARPRRAHAAGVEQAGACARARCFTRPTSTVGRAS